VGATYTGAGATATGLAGTTMQPDVAAKTALANSHPRVLFITRVTGKRWVKWASFMTVLLMKVISHTTPGRQRC
jgi:hypothetical protein